MPALSEQANQLRSIITRVWASCFARTLLMPPAQSKDEGLPKAETADVPRYCYDASLLFRRMTLLQIDRDELARDEPLLLRELQGLCTLCGSKGQCVRDMQRESETGEPQDWRKDWRKDWREYCPNAATLNALGALQNCPRAAQYLKTPHASRLPLTDDGGRHD